MDNDFIKSFIATKHYILLKRAKKQGYITLGELSKDDSDLIKKSLLVKDPALYSNKFFITEDGIEFIKYMKFQIFYKLFPCIVSIISILISIASLFVSFLC